MKKQFKTGNVLSIAAAHLLHDVFASFFAPLIPLLTQKLGFNYAIAGLLTVIQRIPALLNPLIGLMADRLVIRSAIVAAPVVTITCMCLLGIAPSVAALGILFFVFGISAAVFHVTAPVLMRQVSGDKIGRGMSFFMFGGEMARTLGPLLVTAAVSWWGLEGIWRLIPFGLVASLVLFLNLRKIDKRHIQHQQKTEKAPLGQTVREITPFFASITPVMLLRAFSKTALSTFLPAYMVSTGSSIKTAAVALALMELTGAAGALLAGTWSDRIGRKAILIAVAVLSPVLMGLFTIASAPWQWVLIALMGLVLFANTPVFMAMIHDLETDRPSFANGVFMTLNFFAGSIVALLVGIFADRFGFVTTYQLSAAIGLGAIPFTCLIRTKSNDSSAS
ncbi:MFS transporter [Tichowtungia aerotolerans]|uniref:MFS transporter n=1 Tax=Tichowtungia aerotolerans TaxID=2697043 RepID=A0A6P1M5Z3_9BACT|nr:MFS transporter [Tichowtungia aerotolerans]QHI69452.1 MFS transporter [Tichowtungia aerotolerans]